MPKEYHLRKVIDQYCKNNGFKLNPRVESSDTNSLTHMALINKGITILPNFYTNYTNKDNLEFLNLSDKLASLEIGVFYRKGTYFSKTIEVFIHELKTFYSPSISTDL